MRYFNILMLLTILMFLSGCDKNEKIIYPEGNIVGFIKLIDEEGLEVEDKSGVTVTIEGFSHSAVTDGNGRFELTGVPAGTYNLVWNKTGYGTQKRFSFQLIGGDIPVLTDMVTLYEIPGIQLQSVDISFADNKINLSGTITESDRFAVQILFSDNPDVSRLNYDFAYGPNGYWLGPATQFSVSISLSLTPYSPGDEIYLMIYFLNPYEMWYWDYETAEYVISTATKASSVINLVLE